MNAKVLQSAFSDHADPEVFRQLFEFLPGVFFFMKDRQGRHITANSATFERFGIKDDSELVGETDEKFFPQEVARGYREDDEMVMRSGRPLLNRLEVFYDEQHNLDWFLTTKLPVKDRKGIVIGVVGITRRDEDRMNHHDLSSTRKALDFVRANHHKNLSAADLAKAAGVSTRHLHRQLRETLGITPHELVITTRIRLAAEALVHTSLPIVEIAVNHGFCDQSAFTLQFRKRTGMTPKKFRERNQL